ncbi:MAG: uracil-DNA glycosylase [Clostridium sp.]|nr:uracil-DNA glycosylase [Clostridium sp.]
MDLDFTPIVLPEHKAPEESVDYEQCEVYIQNPRIIWGEGNPAAPIITVLDNPGERRDKEGKEFVCGTRQTLQWAIQRCGLNINDVYVTYLLKCRPLRRYDKERARAFSKPFLTRQIEKMQPVFIVLLGDTVVQTIFNNADAHVKDLRGTWHTYMECPSIVSYHPLAVRRRPNLANYFIQDWEMLSQRFLNKT